MSKTLMFTELTPIFESLGWWRGERLVAFKPLGQAIIKFYQDADTVVAKNGKRATRIRISEGYGGQYGRAYSYRYATESVDELFGGKRNE